MTEEKKKEGNGFVMEGETALPQMDFSSFVFSLATQALIQMGESPAPEGMSIPQDLEAARQTIDILVMLQKKTKGNLDSTEGKLIEEMIYNLRVSYLKHQSLKDPSAGSQGK